MIFVEQLPIANGRPQVPGALVVPCTRGYYIAYYTPVGRGPSLTMYEVTPGTYAVKLAGPVQARQNVIGLSGRAYSAYARAEGRSLIRYWRATGVITLDIEGTRQIPITNRIIRIEGAVPSEDATVNSPWNFSGATLTRATPSLPGECGSITAVDLAGL